MSKAINLNNLRVASPCPKAWENMIGDDRVRFCDHCSLNVYNLSELTRPEAQRLISSGERVCGRLHRRADGTVLTKDCPVGLRAVRQRLSRRTAAIFATLLGLSTAVFAQHSTDNDGCRRQVRIIKTESSNAGSSLSGTIVDPSAATIPGARITIKNTKTGETNSVLVNADGAFSFASLTGQDYSLTIEAPGFKTLKKQNLSLEKNRAVVIEVALEVSGEILLGDRRRLHDRQAGRHVDHEWRYSPQTSY